jgi:hypothetical protein
MTDSRYHVDAANVVHDVFDDGEAAVINLATGSYYSLTGSASFLWPALVEGATIQELVAAAVQRYSGDPLAVESAMRLFAEHLVKEGLVSTRPAGDRPGAAPSGVQAAAPGELRPPFEEPRLERFDDLQELILLDPVHDVTDLGWPHAPAS